MRKEWEIRRSDIIINIDKAILKITEYCRFPEAHLVELVALYLTFLDKIFPAADFAIPVYIKMVKVPDDGNT